MAIYFFFIRVNVNPNDSPYGFSGAERSEAEARRSLAAVASGGFGGRESPNGVWGGAPV